MPSNRRNNKNGITNNNELINVNLHWVGTEPDDKLAINLCRKLNGLFKNHLFCFEYAQQHNLLFDRDKIEEASVGDTLDPTYTKEQYFNRLKNHPCDASEAYRIGITAHAIEKIYFNAQDVSASPATSITPEVSIASDKSNSKAEKAKYVGIITTKGINKYIPSGLNKVQYLSFLVLCVALCMHSKYDFEEIKHEIEEIKYCLFDRCEVPDDLTRSLEEPFICPRCKAKLNIDEDIFQSHIQPILGYIKKKNFFIRILPIVHMKNIGVVLAGILTVVNPQNCFVVIPIWILIGGLFLVELFADVFNKRKRK